MRSTALPLQPSVGAPPRRRPSASPPLRPRPHSQPAAAIPVQALLPPSAYPSLSRSTAAVSIYNDTTSAASSGIWIHHGTSTPSTSWICWALGEDNLRTSIKFTRSNRSQCLYEEKKSEHTSTLPNAEKVGQILEGYENWCKVEFRMEQQVQEKRERIKREL
uniref:Uncharacterized protein n=1 Tax=Setaria viridis TaxID=4556 RepID=A0A4U6W741_SETVI|nr:hypothetical protein SEVIR_1G035950v2 [Setaria viridis]